MLSWRRFLVLCCALGMLLGAAPAQGSFIDRCVNKMGGSPEYAWAMAHPEAKFTSGDPIVLGEMGLLYVFVWPGSPGAGNQQVLKFGTPPFSPMAETPDEKAEDVFQSEAILLANAYRAKEARLRGQGVSDADATAAAVAEVKADARTWCIHVTNPAFWPQ
jgi:hypothetical protein